MTTILPKMICLQLVMAILLSVAPPSTAWVMPSRWAGVSRPSSRRSPTRSTTLEMTLVDGAIAADPSIFLSQLDTFWQTCPYTAAAVVCGVKASAADLIAQRQANANDSDALAQEQLSCKDTTTLSFPGSALASSSTIPPQSNDDDLMVDGRRNLAFALYGALYQGLVHEYVFNHLYPAWFGTGVDLDTICVKVGFNLFVQTTLVTLPVAYLLTALVEGNHNKASHQNELDATRKSANDNDDDNHLLQPLTQALQKYQADICQQGLLWKCFALWGPVQCITFTVIPEHYRVTWIALVSFFWLILLSGISHTDNVDADTV